MRLDNYEVVATIAGKLLMYCVKTCKVVVVYATDSIDVGEYGSIKAMKLETDTQRLCNLRAIIKKRLVKATLIGDDSSDAVLWRMTLLLPERVELDIIEGYKEYCHKLPYENKIGNMGVSDMLVLRYMSDFEAKTGIRANSVLSAFRTSSTKARVYYTDNRGFITYIQMNTNKQLLIALRSMIAMYYISRVDKESIETSLDCILGQTVDYVRCSDLIGKNIMEAEDELVKRYLIAEKGIYRAFEVEYTRLDSGEELFAGEISLKFRDYDIRETNRFVRENIDYIKIIIKEELIKAIMSNGAYSKISDIKLEGMSVVGNSTMNMTIVYNFVSECKNKEKVAQAV